MLAFEQTCELHMFFKKGLGDCRCIFVEGYIPEGPTGNTLCHVCTDTYFLQKTFNIILWFLGPVYRKVWLTLRIKKNCNVWSSKEHLCGQRWKVHFFVLFIYSSSPSFSLLHLIHYPEKSKGDFSDQCSSVGVRCNQRLGVYCITKGWDLVTDQIISVRGRYHRSAFRVHCHLE